MSRARDKQPQLDDGQVVRVQNRFQAVQAPLKALARFVKVDIGMRIVSRLARQPPAPSLKVPLEPLLLALVAVDELTRSSDGFFELLGRALGALQADRQGLGGHLIGHCVGHPEGIQVGDGGCNRPAAPRTHRQGSHDAFQSAGHALQGTPFEHGGHELDRAVRLGKTPKGGDELGILIIESLHQLIDRGHLVARRVVGGVFTRASQRQGREQKAENRQDDGGRKRTRVAREPQMGARLLARSRGGGAHTSSLIVGRQS